ncbi:MAG: ribokinase [Clostridiales bacterium]|nr:ribokinase [Clostridiales bacterium]
MAHKVAVIGICGISVFINLSRFPQKGETLVADSMFEEIGGKGINQAIAACRMGADVSFLAAIGDDSAGNECRNIAEKNNINAHFKEKKGKRTPIAFILTDKKGENCVTEYKSAELCSDDVLAFEEYIAASDILLLQQEVPPEVNETALKIAKTHGVRVVLNPAPAREEDNGLTDSVFAVTPNETEAKSISSQKYENCIVTLGSKGCLINGEIEIPSIDVNAVDTTGAGDTFNGVLAVCIAEGMDLKKACNYAVTASGISVSKRYVLNSIPYRDDIERIMKNE